MDDLTNDLAVDDAALFADLTGTPVVEQHPEPAAPAAAEPAAPAVDLAVPAAVDPASAATVPSSRLREESERARNAEREAADLRAQIKTLTAKPATAEPTKPKDLWEDPKGFTNEIVSEALSPVHEQVRNIVFTYSKRDAVRDFTAEVVGAAEVAMKAAIESGAVNRDNVRAQLNASLDPVGDVVRWHKQQSAMTRVGSDPDAFFKTELEKLMQDPTKAPEWAKALLKLDAAPAPAAQPAGGRPAPVISMPSLQKIGTAAAPSASSEPSDTELFASTNARRR